MHGASEEAKKTAAGAMSSTWPMRPSAVRASTCLLNSPSEKPAARTPSVSTMPGLMEFTRMLRGPNSLARVLVIASTAPLVVVYTGVLGGVKVLTAELGASLSDLTKAMGINRPSLYAAFGDKEALLRKALDRYVSAQACNVQEALKEATARGFAERLLLSTAESMCRTGNPSGCLLVHGALASGGGSAPRRPGTDSPREAGGATLSWALGYAPNL